MLSKMRKTNNKGFTLIELMIVIAIIGILAAIAIPNFISYRNKSFCSATESDGNNIAAGVADYFAIPANVSVTKPSLELTAGKVYVAPLLSNQNTWTLTAAQPNTAITITVLDVSGRCPADYQAAMTAANDPRSFWAGGVYTKIMAP